MNSKVDERVALVVTALPVEFKAVESHLYDCKEDKHPQNTVYTTGKFKANNGAVWRVSVAQIGPGNPGAASETERAIAHFNPSVALFVGVAGGLKDVKLCDVVAANRVYGYEYGKHGDTFQPRPDVGESSHGLVQRAFAEARKEKWLQRLSVAIPVRPEAHVGPIAAGEKVLVSTSNDVATLLRHSFGDALAVEMEGRGFLKAVHANPEVHALVIRGISDLVDAKDVSDREGYQRLAAHTASAFAFEVLANWEGSSPQFSHEDRVRDFVNIVGNALDKSGVSLKEYPQQNEALEKMIRGQISCNHENLKIIGNSVWSLVEEKTTKEDRQKNFDAFWKQLLVDLQLRFPRTNTLKQWAQLHQVITKEHYQFDKPKWDAFLESVAKSTLLAPLTDEVSSALEPFRHHVVDVFREINFGGFGGFAAQSEAEGKADLSNVYIDMDTAAQPESRSCLGVLAGSHGKTPALQQLAVLPRLVLIGLPGSGKSTLLKHFSLCLAESGLKPELAWHDHLPHWPKEEQDLIPVFVELRQFATSLPETLPPVEKGRHLENYILEQLPLGLKECAPALGKALSLGRGIVLLDGLDEVPDEDELRRFVLKTVEQFSSEGSFKASRIAVTCRPRSYDDEAWQLKGFDTAELAPLDDEKITRFTNRFYAEVARRDPHVADVTVERKAKLEEALKREELQELASNPFMLTVMAWLHRFQELPRKRASILDTLIGLLLIKWEEGKTRDDKVQIPTLTELLAQHRLGITSLRRVLCRLAFRSRLKRDHSPGDRSRFNSYSISKSELIAELKDLLPHEKVTADHRELWALQMSQIIDRRTGLLVPEGQDSFVMPYKLQEFLAGEHLTNKDELEEVAPSFGVNDPPYNFDGVVALLVDGKGYWDEVVKWAAAFQTHVKNEINEARNLASELCEDSDFPESTELRRAIIASEIIMEVGLAEVTISHKRNGPDCLTRVRKKLDHFMSLGSLAVKQRADAGSARGWLEDLPAGVGVTADNLPNIIWINLPAGQFIMGDREDGNAPPYATIQQDYRISRYPVTVCQFQCFIDDKGYEQEEFWNWSGEANRWFQDISSTCADEKRKLRPENYESVFQTPNHPRVGVSWYEAAAFCRWLGKKLGVQPESISLPTELEWERAARGTEGRGWISDDNSDLGRQGNFSAIGHTSAVGLFPKGDTPPENGNELGVAELAGNVWEWCCNAWGGVSPKMDDETNDESTDAENARVARGGSWNLREFPRLITPLRRGVAPGDRDDDAGFRLVWRGSSAKPVEP